MINVYDNLSERNTDWVITQIQRIDESPSTLMYVHKNLIFPESERPGCFSGDKAAAELLTHVENMLRTGEINASYVDYLAVCFITEQYNTAMGVYEAFNNRQLTTYVESIKSIEDIPSWLSANYAAIFPSDHHNKNKHHVHQMLKSIYQTVTGIGPESGDFITNLCKDDYRTAIGYADNINRMYIDIYVHFVKGVRPNLPNSMITLMPIIITRISQWPLLLRNVFMEHFEDLNLDTREKFINYIQKQKKKKTK